MKTTTKKVLKRKPAPDSEKILRAILNYSPENIVLMDRNYKIIAYNEVIKKTLHEYFGKNIKLGDDYRNFVIVPLKKLFLTSFKKALRGKITDVEVQTKFGQVDIWFRYRMNPVYEPDGKMLGVSLSAVNVDERKRTEMLLKLSQENYHSMFEQASDAIMITDQEGNFLDANTCLCKMFGYTKKELLKSNIRFLIDPEQLKTQPMYFDRLLNGGHVFSQRRMITKRKKIIEVEANVKMLPDGRILAIARDITERKKAEEALRLSEQKYKLLFDKYPIPLIMFSQSDFRFIAVNDAAAEQYRYSKEEFLKMTAKEIRPPKDIGILLDKASRSTKGINNFGIVTHKKKDGTFFKVEVIAHSIVYDGEPVWLAHVQDVTERIKTEEKLEKSEFFFRKVTENEMFGIAWASADGKVLNANTTFCNMVGYPLEELVGVYFGDFTHPEDTQKELLLLKEIIKNKKDFYQIEKRYKTKDGDYIWVELSLSCYRNPENKNPEFFIGIVQNINERKLAEEEIKASQLQLHKLSSHLETIREEERAAISREIHDELGQQLTGLKMDAVWVDRKIPVNNDPVRKKIAGMITLIDHAVKTVRRISTELRPAILDDLGLIDALNWQSNEFEKRTGILCKFKTANNDLSFEKKISTGVFRVYQEALTNVARHAEATEVNTFLEKRRDKVTLRVSDNGIGFDKSVAEKKNTLGLIGMKERVKMFGGKFSIESAIGKGTIIFLEIPDIISVEK